MSDKFSERKQDALSYRNAVEEHDPYIQALEKKFLAQTHGEKQPERPNEEAELLARLAEMREALNPHLRR